MKFCFTVVFATMLVVMAAQRSHVSAHNVTSGSDAAEAGKCPMGASLDMTDEKLLATLFPGLFINRKQLKERAMKKVLAEMVKFKRRKILKKNIFTVEVDDEIANECCEMITEVIMPVTVQHDGVTYDVVHLDSDEQLVTTTSCVTHQEECNSGRRCLHKTGYNWILVWDPALKYYPPVRFVPIQVNVGCSCQ